MLLNTMEILDRFSDKFNCPCSGLRFPGTCLNSRISTLLTTIFRTIVDPLMTACGIPIV